MKPNQKNRHNGRYNNRNSRSTITRNTALESSGPMGKVHGTALQLFEKYQAAAKDALIQNDLVLSQTYMQYADHYMRMQNIAIANEMAMRQNIQEQQRQQQSLSNLENEQVKAELSGSEKGEETLDSNPMQTYAGVQYVNVPVEIDEKTLTEIAGTTNGNYFRATSNSKLKEVYEEIDKLEKTKLNVKEFSKREEEFELFAWIAFLCVLLEVLLRNTLLKKIP